MIYLEECYSNYQACLFLICLIQFYEGWSVQTKSLSLLKKFQFLQIQNLNHQKVSLEEMVAQERAQATEQVAAMSQKLKDVQEMLFVKMREASSSHDCHMPLKAEISAMKALLEEEEKRSLVFNTHHTNMSKVDGM